MKKIIFTIICVVALFGGIFAGAKYSELSEARYTEIVSQKYDTKLGKYLIEIEIKNGFGKIVDVNYYYSEHELM